jgi:hypothetical protein
MPTLVHERQATSAPIKPLDDSLRMTRPIRKEFAGLVPIGMTRLGTSGTIDRAG